MFLCSVTLEVSINVLGEPAASMFVYMFNKLTSLSERTMQME
jgi:hypothetical protein